MEDTFRVVSIRRSHISCREHLELLVHRSVSKHAFFFGFYKGIVTPNRYKIIIQQKELL
jgi:hypothetical protein